MQHECQHRYDKETAGQDEVDVVEIDLLRRLKVKVLREHEVSHGHTSRTAVQIPMSMPANRTTTIIIVVVVVIGLVIAVVITVIITFSKLPIKSPTRPVPHFLYGTYIFAIGGLLQRNFDL